MLYFDAHIHVGNLNISNSKYSDSLLAYKEYKKNTAEVCVKNLKKNNILKSVIFPFPIIEQSITKQNDYIIYAVKKFPYYFIPFLLPEKIDRLESLKDNFYGIKDHFYFDFELNFNRFSVLEFAQKYSKYYIFHAHWKHWEDRIVEICSNFPKLNVIIAHSARIKPFSGNDDISLLKRIKKIIPRNCIDNFYFETSTIRNNLYINEIINLFGIEKVLWGTDYPYYSKKTENIFISEKKIIDDLNLCKEYKEYIYNKNFRLLFQNEEIWIRSASKDNDSDKLKYIIDNIDNQEKKFLAINKKIDIIKKELSTCTHIFLAENRKGEICGFLRTSDRHNNTVMIEEVYIIPKERGKKIATKLLSSTIASYENAEAKTFSTNICMANILSNLGFIPEYSPKKTMIQWKKQHDK